MGARVWVLAAAIGILLAVSAGNAADNAGYRLGSGDRLRVTVFNEKDLSGDFDVSDQGQIDLPLIGKITVAGLSPGAVEALVREKYGREYLRNPRISVEVLNYRPFFIIGEVQRPGSYPYVNGLTVVTAVALAGGYTARADPRDILIKHGDTLRGGEQRVSEDTPVQPGDVIRVQQRFF